MNPAPLPSADLAAYILGGDVDPDTALELFDAQGQEIRAAIARHLGPGWDWRGRRVLDFGCGAGRVLRQFLDEAREAELHGCDIDGRCIEWLERKLSPPMHVRRIDAMPPLPYEDQAFDAVWAIAVLSHLVDTWADWLVELHRVLVPGGLLLATVMGESSSHAIAGEDWDPNRIGMTVLGAGRPWEAGGPMSLHSEWWVRAHWGRAFDVIAYEPGGVCGQDAVVMRKRAAVSAEQLRAPEPGEPREFAALAHNLELLHRQYAQLNQAHDEYAAAYHAEVERRRELERRLGAAGPGPGAGRAFLRRAARAVRRR